MYLTSISAKNFRNHDDVSITLAPNVTVFTGKNGAGKTSLIEAIYIALQGSSFRTGDKDIIKWDQTWYRIDVSMNDETVRTVKFDSSRQTGRKQFTIGDRSSYRLSAKDKIPVVLFEPEDLRLINGSPSRRRQFIDRFISQVDPRYHQALLRYERALRQRNNLLKKTSDTDELFVWNVTLSEYGAYIMTERIAFIEKINQRLGDIYRRISNTDDLVSIHYSHTLVDNIQQKLLIELSRNSEKDRLLGYTTTGPHRDDVLFNYNHSPASSTASRGENRTIILSLKDIEVEIIENITGSKPIVLLDDVFSELDEQRRTSLLDADTQLIVTTTDHDKNWQNVIRID